MILLDPQHSAASLGGWSAVSAPNISLSILFWNTSEYNMNLVLLTHWDYLMCIPVPVPALGHMLGLPLQTLEPGNQVLEHTDSREIQLKNERHACKEMQVFHSSTGSHGNLCVPVEE